MKWRTFWYGTCVGLSYSEFIQHFMGRESYFKTLNLAWIDSHWSLWLLSMALFTFITVLEPMKFDRKSKKFMPRHSALCDIDPDTATWRRAVARNEEASVCEECFERFFSIGKRLHIVSENVIKKS